MAFTIISSKTTVPNESRWFLAVCHRALVMNGHLFLLTPWLNYEEFLSDFLNDQNLKREPKSSIQKCPIRENDGSNDEKCRFHQA